MFVAVMDSSDEGFYRSVVQDVGVVLHLFDTQQSLPINGSVISLVTIVLQVLENA